MDQSKKQFSVLIAQGNSNLILFIVNCLSQIKGIKISVIVNREFLELKYSQKVFNYAYYPNSHDEIRWLDNIKKEIEKQYFDIVMPVDEFGIKTMIKHKHNLSYSSKLCLLPSLKSFNTANNKGLLWEHMKAYNIPCPKTFIYNEGEFHDNDLIDFPIILKPLVGFGGGQGIHVFKEKEQLVNYYNNNKDSYPYLIQDYITGYDIDCSVLCVKGSILAYTIQKGTLAGQNDFVPKIGLQFVFEPDLLRVVKKLIKTLDWSGVAHIDMRYDEKDKQFKVIEINPRFWETTEASEIAGVNFPYLYLLKNLNIEFEIPNYKPIKYLNLLGLKKTVKKNIFFLFNIRFILKNTSIKYYLKDSLPLLYMVYNKVKSLFR